MVAALTTPQRTTYQSEQQDPRLCEGQERRSTPPTACCTVARPFRILLQSLAPRRYDTKWTMTLTMTL